ncbi:hypothetical protein HS088_TW15G01219 [Tripterygium wilfordii]|uniref:Uncharacterized protein n=1 Tax=Tripterygium wilfordii TaxID=458696 RepID=A0A7J7CNQ5_TRIWF|nr:hypothetical protein HS088_TW15G01219 [Tripterygium wilfordii]
MGGGKVHRSSDEVSGYTIPRGIPACIEGTNEFPSVLVNKFKKEKSMLERKREQLFTQHGVLTHHSFHWLTNPPYKDCAVPVGQRWWKMFAAAIMWQKRFRTRRKLADCAVLVGQRWWSLLDFAELKRKSVLFYYNNRRESANSRWPRVATRAAKIGKGLSKNENAQQIMSFRHWHEAIDPCHRYGHNLEFYYKRWLQCHGREPFFYWLDKGEGKEVVLDNSTAVHQVSWSSATIAAGRLVVEDGILKITSINEEK